MRMILIALLSLCTATTAIAQTATTPAPDMSGQLQKLLSNPKNAQALSQALAVGTLMGCTQKQAGKEATQAFYQDMTAVGKNVSAYCKEGHATEARALVLSTLQQNQNSPVYLAALQCYDAQAANIPALAGPETAQKMATYASWARDVPKAEQNIKESDICKKAL